MTNWQPIETAPENKGDVLLYVKSTGEQFVGFRYNDHAWQWAVERDGAVMICIPTHWQPLPNPPEDNV